MGAQGRRVSEAASLAHFVIRSTGSGAASARSARATLGTDRTIVSCRKTPPAASKVGGSWEFWGKAAESGSVSEAAYKPGRGGAGGRTGCPQTTLADGASGGFIGKAVQKVDVDVQKVDGDVHHVEGVPSARRGGTFIRSRGDLPCPDRCRHATAAETFATWSMTCVTGSVTCATGVGDLPCGGDVAVRRQRRPSR